MEERIEKVIESKLIGLLTGYIDESFEIDKKLTTEQVTFIKGLLKDLEENNIRLIGNSAWHSIAVYFQCRTEDSFRILDQMCKSGELQKILEQIFQCLHQSSDCELIKSVCIKSHPQELDSDKKPSHPYILECEYLIQRTILNYRCAILNIRKTFCQ